MHWAYIQWIPEVEGAHELTVSADHAHKRCAKNPRTQTLSLTVT